MVCKPSGRPENKFIYRINEQNLIIKREEIYSCVRTNLWYNHFGFHKSILYVQSAKTDMKLQYLKRDNSYNEILEDERILQEVLKQASTFINTQH